MVVLFLLVDSSHPKSFSMFPQTILKGVSQFGLFCIIATCILNMLDGLLHIITAGSSLAAWLPEVIMNAQKNDFNENI